MFNCKVFILTRVAELLIHKKKQRGCFLLDANKQIIDCPTRIPDNTNDTPHLLDLFLSTAPTYYSVSVSAPIGNSDHNLIKIKSPIDLVKNAQPQRNQAFSQSQLG